MPTVICSQNVRKCLSGALALALTLFVSLASGVELVDPDTEHLVFHHRDALGTTNATTDINGNVVHHTSTTPYGGDPGRRANDGLGFIDNAQPSTRSEDGYTGHVNDRRLELTYMRARFYDPSIGRFLSNDPLGFVSSNPTSFNRYAYANNSPYAFVDPDGRNAVSLFGGIVWESLEGGVGVGDGQADYEYLGGALRDGYDGQGSGVGAAATQDVLESRR